MRAGNLKGVLPTAAAANSEQHRFQLWQPSERNAQETVKVHTCQWAENWGWTGKALGFQSSTKTVWHKVVHIYLTQWV